MPDQPSPTPDRTCFVCGAGASSGFNTLRGDVWTCMAHRAAGKAQVVPPGPMARVPGGTR